MNSDHDKGIYATEELVEATRAWREACQDEQVPGEGLSFVSPRSLVVATPGVPSTLAPLNDLAAQQLSDRLGVPHHWLYSDKCPGDLRQTVLTRLLTNRATENFLVRYRKEGDNWMVRAFLTSDYSPINHQEIIESMEAAFSEGGMSGQFMRVALGDTLHAYYVITGTSFDSPSSGKPDGGGLHPAVYVTNSEVGTGYFRIHGGLYRSVCSNGMIFGWTSTDGIAIPHRGSQNWLREIVNEAIADALSLSETSAERFLRTMAVKLPRKDIAGIVKRWGEKYGMYVDARSNWLARVAGEGDVPLWDIINAATALAQHRPLVERESIERMAGEMVEADWKNGG